MVFLGLLLSEKSVKKKKKRREWIQQEQGLIVY